MIKKLLIISICLLLTTFSYSQETYYNDVDLTLSGTDLKDALATKIIATHTNVLPYTSSQPDTWDAIKITDEYINPQKPGDVTLFYGWENGTDQDITNDISRDERFQDDGSGALDVWNREHVFPKSLANPILNTDVPGAATDAHHLRAADRTRNSTRNNRKYGRGTGTSNFSTVDFHAGLDGPNTAAWYPGDQWKGDAARMIMYMYLRYGAVCLPTAVGVGSKQFTQDEMIDLFLQWNAEDPVSQIEKTRNTYHEDLNNAAAQGNRNPFIDNPYLATRIWGGDSAEDLWGIYTSTDTQAPTTPTNVIVDAINFTAFDVSWAAATDNIAVTGYNVFVDGVLTSQTTTNLKVTITNLTPNTSYAITVLAKDLINNKSAQSIAVNGTTLQDTTPPTTPTNLVFSNVTDTSFKLIWAAATDNNAVTAYDVYLNGTLNATVTALNHTIINLTPSTNYTCYVIAKDGSGNSSSQSQTANTTTTAGGMGVASELFISEYVEPFEGNNKALEIVNLTGSTVSLVGYSIRKQSNGSGTWVDDFSISTGTVNSIIPNDVFVITHIDTANDYLIAESDLLGPPNIDTTPNPFGSPLNFNGNDPIGLFKDGVLIDIIGDFNGGSSVFAANVTLRRNSDVTGPSTTFNEQDQWTAFPQETFNGIGFHTATSSVNGVVFNNFKMYPNPTNSNTLFFDTDTNAKVEIYTILGKRILSNQVSNTNKEINIASLSKGIYIVKIMVDNNFISKKLIKK
jgi:endonuclease I/chitodextrinase